MRVRRPLINPALAGLEASFRAIRAAAGISDVYADDVVAEAEASARSGELAHISDDRADATDIPMVTIDPAGSRDLDQAVHIEPRGDGHRVHYAIADVGAHVPPGGALDRDTRARVETVYCPDARVGLHPPVLSEGFASLLPGARTKAVLWTIDLDSSGDIVATDVRRTWVQSRAQYSYVGLTAAPPPEALGLVASMAEVGKRRRSLARARGAVTLPKPTQEYRVEGDRVSLEFRAGLGIEDDNAQISLLTGEAAARLMLAGGVGILRTMPPAEEGALIRLRRQAKALGVDWTPDESYGDLLTTLDPGSPRVAAFLTAATALFRGAAWVGFDDSDPTRPRPANMNHGALGVPYAHVTAPLRRLVDRFGTEMCLAFVAGRPVPSWARESLAWVGADMARGAHIGKSIDRSCIEAVEVAMLGPHVGEEFSGIALDETTIQIADPAIIGRCDSPLQAGSEVRVTLTRASPTDGILFGDARAATPDAAAALPAVS